MSEFVGGLVGIAALLGLLTFLGRFVGGEIRHGNVITRAFWIAITGAFLAFAVYFAYLLFVVLPPDST